MKFQQYTGPLQAKGLEDTAFYRYNVLFSLNEVGGDPSRFGVIRRGVPRAEPAARAATGLSRCLRPPRTTRSSAKTSARGINVLSEFPDEWAREVAQWMRLNRRARTIVDGEPAPDRNDEYRLYQALLGGWIPGSPNRRRSSFERMPSTCQVGPRGEGAFQLDHTQPGIRGRTHVVHPRDPRRGPAAASSCRHSFRSSSGSRCWRSRTRSPRWC